MLRCLRPQIIDVHVAVRVLRTTTTRMPAVAALAGLVPCAEAGISTTLRPARRDRGDTRESPSAP